MTWTQAYVEMLEAGDCRLVGDEANVILYFSSRQDTKTFAAAGVSARLKPYYCSDPDDCAGCRAHPCGRPECSYYS